MKVTVFDDLARSLAEGTSRRQVLKLLTTGVAGGFLAIKDATGGSAAPKSSVAIQVSSLSSSSSGNTVIGPNTFEVLPYRAPGYRFKIISANRRPPIGFEADDFDDRDFGTGTAAFGSAGAGCPLQATVATLWPVRSQLIVRHSFFLPTGTTDVRLMMSIDNDLIKVFVNGVLIGNATHERCPVLDEFQLTVPDSLVRPGLNLIAVHARDRGVESFFDMRVLADLPVASINAGLTTEALEQLKSAVDTLLPLAPLTNFSVACDATETRVAFFIEKVREPGKLRFKYEIVRGRLEATTAHFLIANTLVASATRKLTSAGVSMTVVPGPGAGRNAVVAVEAFQSIMRLRSVQLALARCSAPRGNNLLSSDRVALVQQQQAGDDTCSSNCTKTMVANGSEVGLSVVACAAIVALIFSPALAVPAGMAVGASVIIGTGGAALGVGAGYGVSIEYEKCLKSCSNPAQFPPDPCQVQSSLDCLPPCDSGISPCLSPCGTANGTPISCFPSDPPPIE